jgi:hypothetical protein
MKTKKPQTKGEARHPLQPVVVDEGGVRRFKGNAIVKFLLDQGPFDMNKIALLAASQEDREQFAQLIGYSVSGFSELSYVSDEAVATAAIMRSDPTRLELQARNEALRAQLRRARLGLRLGVADLFGMHPDDLGPASGED